MNKPEYIKLLNDNLLVTKDWETRFGTVPKGFISDGVSSPWVFRWFIHKYGELIIAAIYHDWCYKTAYKTKIYADNMFYSIAIQTGANKFKAKIAYWAVHFFGKGNYK